MSEHHDLAALPLAPELELRLEAGVRGCFSEGAREIALGWDAAGAWWGPARRPLDRAQAEALARRITEAACRREVPTGGSSTTWYEARLRWRAPGASGELRFQSREVPRELALDLLRGRPELLARVPADAYMRASGLEALARALAAELG